MVYGTNLRDAALRTRCLRAAALTYGILRLKIATENCIFDA